MKIKLCLLASVAFLAGCTPRPEWKLKREPMTEVDRAACAQFVERVMAATPKTLSGHDQDWDDAIRAAESAATDTQCRPTLWEYQPYGFPNPGGEWTGRWKYFEQAKQAQ